MLDGVPSVSIDFPREGEKIRQGHYAIRITADDATEAQISIDKGPWKTCRRSAGYFWLDFWPHPHEIHEMVARARVGQGPWGESELRTCDVIEE